MTSPCPEELKQLYRERRVLPFIGAGATMAMEWLGQGGEKIRGPSWRELVDEACNMLGYDPELLRMRGTDLQILEFFGIQMGNFAPLTNWLVRRLNPSDEDIKESRLHTALASLTNCRLYYTTNYDDFLERSLKIRGRAVKSITSERNIGFLDGDTHVVKFHGDFNDPDAMVFSEGHYYKRMRMVGDLDLRLRSDLLGRAAVFVGYSFSDINIAYLFEQMNSEFLRLPNSSSGRRAYIIAHNPSSFEYKLFEKRNITIIPTRGDDRTGATAEVIEDMIG